MLLLLWVSKLCQAAKRRFTRCMKAVLYTTTHESSCFSTLLGKDTSRWQEYWVSRYVSKRIEEEKCIHSIISSGFVGSSWINAYSEHIYWNILYDRYSVIGILGLSFSFNRKIKRSPSKYNKPLTETIVKEGKIENVAMILVRRVVYF